ncbi:MAG: Mov34/MPN/PAD-1 family protein [Candidatus Woesearchaeota archaeon]
MINFSDGINNLLARLLPRPQPVRSILLKQSVVLDIIQFAKSNFPKEFVAVLQGRIVQGTVTVTGIIYQPYVSARSTAIMQMNLPMLSDSVGSVHSHPSASNQPSDQDLQFFGKRGIVNLIIAYPFNPNTLACYDRYGNRMDFSIVS